MQKITIIKHRHLSWICYVLIRNQETIVRTLQLTVENGEKGQQKTNLMWTVKAQYGSDLRHSTRTTKQSEEISSFPTRHPNTSDAKSTFLINGHRQEEWVRYKNGSIEGCFYIGIHIAVVLWHLFHFIRTQWLCSVGLPFSEHRSLNYCAQTCSKFWVFLNFLNKPLSHRSCSLSFMLECKFVFDWITINDRL
jgi:hypothetical protein